MRLMIAMLAAVMLVGIAGTALAQSGVEITPLVGYRWGGGMSSITGIREFDTKDNFSYGVILAKRTPHNSAVEIEYVHFSGDVDLQLNNGSHVAGRGPLKRDDIMLNGSWYAYRQGPTRPFFTLGAGAAIFSSDATETIGRFAWNLGAGVRRDMSDKMGLRIAAVWWPTWVTTGSGLWCDPYYCYSVGTGEYYDQFELSAGLIFKL